MKTHFKYIHFSKIEDKPKTSVWGCYNNVSLTPLGIVKWHPLWRQYCYFPTPNTVYSTGCIEDINEFIRQLMELRKMKQDMKMNELRGKIIKILHEYGFFYDEAVDEIIQLIRPRRSSEKPKPKEDGFYKITAKGPSPDKFIKIDLPYIHIWEYKKSTTNWKDISFYKICGPVLETEEEQ